MWGGNARKERKNQEEMKTTGKTLKTRNRPEDDGPRRG